MEYTTNYNLKKPSYDDKTDVADLNYNADIIDNQMKENSNAIAGKQDTLTFDTTPTSGSTNPVTSGGIYNEFAKLQLCTGIFTEFVDALPAGKHIVYCNGNAITNGTPEGYMLMHVIKYAAAGGTNAVLAIGKCVVTNANLYTINRANSGWGSWYRYVGTAV